uniref:Regucalcin n=1 Tax=Riptortus pedestris TaxID=329032 RepID=R4WCS5_RIPPE|nr:anterior fat body protein [Riptortus pedestris]
MASPKIEKLSLPPLGLGEGPHWSVDSESLYLVDIHTSELFRYHPSSGKYYSVKLDVPSIGFVTPVAGTKDQFLIGAGTDLQIVKWDGISSSVESLNVIHSLSDELKTNRINDGKSDPVGRAWFGTMRTKDILDGKEGNFYSFTKEKGSTKHFTGVGISNGMAWNLGKNRMYYIDSLRHSVDAVDYSTDGTIGNRRVVFDLKKNDFSFFPDGMTIDTDGKLWVACYNGSRVLNIDPDSGNLLGQINLPTSKITSAAWGGKNLDELYITSAGAGEDDSDSNAGQTFRVTGLSAHGSPMYEFKL